MCVQMLLRGPNSCGDKWDYSPLLRSILLKGNNVDSIRPCLHEFLYHDNVTYFNVSQPFPLLCTPKLPAVYGLVVLIKFIILFIMNIIGIHLNQFHTHRP
jgi:hypothetical protein